MRNSQPDDEKLAPLPAEVLQYWTCRRRTRMALLAFAAGVVALAIFHNPAAWGSGEVARVVYYAAWIDIVLSGLVAYQSNAKMAEHHGYCRGKFGQTPAEIAATRESPP